MWLWSLLLLSLSCDVYYCAARSRQGEPAARAQRTRRRRYRLSAAVLLVAQVDGEESLVGVSAHQLVTEPIDHADTRADGLVK